MALDFQALQTEFYARGFEYLNDGGAGVTRAKRLLNDAMHEIDELFDWPYLNAATTGTAPLTVSDLRTVESVVITARSAWLAPIDRRTLTESVIDVTTTGTPSFFYVTGGTVINVFPANTTDTLTVKYWKFGPDLSANGDAPLMPDRYRMAIVHYAVASALEDKSNYQEAAAARARGDQLVDRMRQSLLAPQHAAVETQPVFGDDA